MCSEFGYLLQYFPRDIANIIDVYIVFLNFEEVVAHSKKLTTKGDVSAYLEDHCKIKKKMTFQCELEMKYIVSCSKMVYENEMLDVKQYSTVEKVLEIIKYSNCFIVYEYFESYLNSDPMVLIPDDILNFLNNNTRIIHKNDFILSDIILPFEI